MRWLERQLNDPYVNAPRAEGYRSRAAYKLIELDERFGLLKGVKRVVDLGIAPGGWARWCARPAPSAAVVGIDLLPVEPLEGVDDPADGLHGRRRARTADRAALDGPPDLVLSDMAANTVGHQQTDHLRTMGLVEAAAHFAVEVLGRAARSSPRCWRAARTPICSRCSSGTSRPSSTPSRRRAARSSSEWYVD